MSNATLPPPSPLAWPDDWQRTPLLERRQSRYRVPPGVARKSIEHALQKMRARDLVISSNLAVRLDGLPRVGAREPLDPGIAVWWLDHRGTRRVIACDQWRSTYENMRAIGLALEHIRGLERSGATQILDRTMQAFATKLLGAGEGAQPWWFTRLGLRSWPPAREDVATAYRSRAKLEHPDAGGSAEEFVKLNEAHAAAQRWLDSQREETT